jgi:hypothetical protein
MVFKRRTVREYSAFSKTMNRILLALIGVAACALLAEAGGMTIGLIKEKSELNFMELDNWSVFWWLPGHV